jgi:hypothetical protein
MEEKEEEEEFTREPKWISQLKVLSISFTQNKYVTRICRHQ